MSGEFLFIGGCNDGKLMSIPGEILHSVRIAKKETVSSIAPVEFDTYEPMKFKGDSETFVVYLLSGMRADEALERLISGYRHDKNHD